MIPLTAAAWIVAFAGVCALVLWGAKVLSTRWPSQEGRIIFHASSGLALAIGVIALAWLHGWAQTLVAAATAVLATYRASVSARTGDAWTRYSLLELYAALLSIVALRLHDTALFDGMRAGPRLSFAVHEAGSRLALAPVRWLSSHVSAFDHRLAGQVETELIERWLDQWSNAITLLTFAVAWCAVSYLARRAIETPGRSLVPGVAVIGILWAAGVLEGSSSGTSWLVAVSAPPLAAEGVRTLAQLAKPLASRAVLVGVAALALPLLHEWALLMAGVGWVAGSLRPWLVLESRFASDEVVRVRPVAILWIGAAAASGILLLSSLSYATFTAVSPLIGAAPRLCTEVHRVATADGVEFSAASSRFTIDREETRSSPVASRQQAEAVCAREHKRLCTSDEWYLACLCTYPTESQSGMQMTGNELLAHAVARGRADLQRRSAEAAVYGLLDGKSEVVATPSRNDVWIAGANGVMDDAWMTDCRYRAAITESALAENAWSFIGVRCCR